MSKFHIGQRVVAVRDHHQGAYKKGDTFKVKGANKCRCGSCNIDIGIPSTKRYRKCVPCGHREFVLDGIWWFRETAFAPIEPRSVEIDEEIIEQAQELINVREVVKGLPQPVHN